MDHVFPFSHSDPVPTKLDGVAPVGARGEFDITRNNKSQAYQLCPDVQGYCVIRTEEMPCSLFLFLCQTLKRSGFSFQRPVGVTVGLYSRL